MTAEQLQRDGGAATGSVSERDVRRFRQQRRRELLNAGEWVTVGTMQIRLGPPRA
jgi:hypothetical protein